MIRRLTTVLCTAVLSSFSISATAAETNVVEAFGCNFNDGKTMTDLDAVVKYYSAERSKIGELHQLTSKIRSLPFFDNRLLKGTALWDSAIGRGVLSLGWPTTTGARILNWIPRVMCWLLLSVKAILKPGKSTPLNTTPQAIYSGTAA